MLRINGNALFNSGTLRFDFLNFTPKVGNSWAFLYANAIIGWETLKFDIAGLGDGDAAQFSFANGAETMRIVHVPEPSSLLLSAMGLGGLALWRRLKGV